MRTFLKMSVEYSRATRDIIAEPETLPVASKYRGQKAPAQPGAATDTEVRLLVDWPDPVAVFLDNLADRFHGRVVPVMASSSAPDHDFWRDIDLMTPFPRRGLRDSVCAHLALLGLLYAVSIWPQSTAHLANPISHSTLNGYQLSEYLPELHGVLSHRASNKRGKHDPVPAKQQILSIPDKPDNLHQTIVTPPKLKIDHDVALPNIVDYQPTAPVQPLEASKRNPASLRLPKFVPEVVGPTADANSLRSRSKLKGFEPRIVEPAPDVAQRVANPRLALPTFSPSVVQPAPDLGHIHGHAGGGSTSRLAHLAPRVAEPVPDAPHVTGATRTGSSRQIIALSLHPAEPHGPVQVPSGNRRGEFAASPDGHHNASGRPGTGASGRPTTGASVGSGANVPNTLLNGPAGISVTGAAPATAVTGAVTGQRASAFGQSAITDTRQKQEPADSSLKAKLLAMMRPPVTSLPPRQPLAHETESPRSELENRIFRGRHSYTLSVNMPNLNTVTGSWIIHFVEREHSGSKSPIVAPEVVSKSDPSCPGELIGYGIRGTVILTAVIRADGKVSEIAVAKSLEPRIDRNAVKALSHWLFHPALKDGRAIDVEAVITVPFHTNVAKF